MFIHKTKSQLYQYFFHERHYIMFAQYFFKDVLLTKYLYLVQITVATLLEVIVLCTEANAHGHNLQESCKQNCHLDHDICSSSCRKQHTFNKFEFFGFSVTPIEEAEAMTQSSVLTQHGVQTASSSTMVCVLSSL